MVIKNKADEVLKSDWLAELGTFSTTQQKEITDLGESIKKDSESIITAVIKADKEVVEKRAERDSKVGRKIEKTIFDVKEKIHYAHNPVLQSVIAPELSNNIRKFNELVGKEHQIDEFYNGQAENEGKIQALKDGVPLTDDVVKPFQNVVEVGGFNITQEAIEDKEGFLDLFNKAKAANLDLAKQAIYLKEIKDKYGLDKETTNYLGQNRTIFDEENIEYTTLEDEADVEITEEVVPKEEVPRETEISEEKKVILTIGTSGSGKSTWIESLPKNKYTVISPDEMRIEFTGDVNDKSRDSEIYEEVKKRAIEAINKGKQVRL